MKKLVTNINVIVLIVACLLVLNFMENGDAVAEKRLYCENVADGTWPDTQKFNCKN